MEKKTVLTIRLNPDFHHELRVLTVEQGTTIQAVTEAYLRQWVETAKKNAENRRSRS